MDVNEKLERGMYRDPARMEAQPTIEQDNDIEAPFSIITPASIPLDLQEIIHQAPSVDLEPEVIEQVNSDVKVNVEEVAEENPQSRFRVLDVAIKKPGVCALCGSSGGDGRQFVDFGKTVDWYGVVYFCTFCIGEAAKLLGFATAVEVNVMKDQINGLNDVLSEMTEERSQAIEAANASRILLRNCHCGDSNPSYSDVVDVSVVEEVDESASDDIADDNESGSVEGSDGVSEFASYDELVEESKPRRRSTRKSSE